MLLLLLVSKETEYSNHQTVVSTFDGKVRIKMGKNFNKLKLIKCPEHEAQSIQRYQHRITKSETTDMSSVKQHEARSKIGVPTVSEIHICGRWKVILNLKTGSMGKKLHDL